MALGQGLNGGVVMVWGHRGVPVPQLGPSTEDPCWPSAAGTFPASWAA